MRRTEDYSEAKDDDKEFDESGSEDEDEEKDCDPELKAFEDGEGSSDYVDDHVVFSDDEKDININKELLTSKTRSKAAIPNPGTVSSHQ